MQIWIDILTPKQLLFLHPLAQLLHERRHHVYLTSRDYREVNQLIKMKNLSIDILGKHGGASRPLKLRSSAQRVIDLTKTIEKKKIDLVVSFSSVESARVAFGLSIPHVSISDSPHAEAVSRLTIPLSKLLFTPWIIPKKAWTRYGIKEDSVVQYKALDPFVWVRKIVPTPNYLKIIGLDKEKPVLTIRPPEEYAAYLLNSPEKSITAKIIEKLLKSNLDLSIVVLPRYQAQIQTYKRLFKKGVMVLDHCVDGANLLSASDIFLGAGGTMTAEAILLGTPTLSCFPSQPTYIDRYLIRQGILQHTLNPTAAVEIIKRYQHNQEIVEHFKRRSRKLRKLMRDPLPLIVKSIERLSSPI
ncbi:DUF354 domain-containing protein [[Eubacterium] cellulosolvens]